MAAGGNARSKFKDTSEPEWYRWRARAGFDPNNQAHRAIRFIETYCRSPSGEGYGKPLKLAQFQRDWITEILRPGVRKAIMQAPRGQGKSTLLAALAVWATFDINDTGQPMVYIMATTVGQAAGAVYDVACKMIAAEPKLDDRCIVHTNVSAAKIMVSYNGGECRPIANEFSALQGKNPSFFIVDEIGEQPLAAWAAAAQASGKRKRSLIVGIGTPGFDRDKSALWHLRQNYLEGTASAGFSYVEHSAPDDCDWRDEANWLIANPAIAEGYLDIEAIRDDVSDLPESYVRTFRLGQWVEGTDCWLGADGRKVWRDLTSDHALVPGADTWVGVDVGLARDCTAIVVGQWNNSVLHTTATIWKPAKDQAVDISAILNHIRQLDATYDVVEVAFDPKHLEMYGAILADEGLPMVVFNQSVERMVPACGELYEAILRREVSHDGAADYERHILNGMLAYSDSGFRLTKSKSRGHIDAAIALALCHARARQPVKKLPKLVCL